MRSIAALCAVVLLVPSWCAADPFNEFRIPAHSWQSGTASFSMNANRYSDSYDYGNPESREVSRALVSGGLRLQRGFDSDRRSTRWTIWMAQNLEASRTKANGTGLFTSLPERSEGWGRRQAGSFAFEGGVRGYPRTSSAGFDLSLGGTGQWFENVGRQDHVGFGSDPLGRDEVRSDLHSNSYTYSIAFSAMLGQGIVRDASVVEDVYVFESRLAAAGVLAHPISPEARAKLAQVLVIQATLGNAHDRPDRFLWREFERVLIEDGALTDAKLDSYSQLRLLESFRLSREWRRLAGHFAGLVVQGSHDHSIRRYDEHVRYRDFYDGSLLGAGEYSLHGDRRWESNRVSLGPAVEWHRPIGWRWQWDISSRVLWAALQREHGLRTQSSASGAWLVADRWQARVSAQHSRDYLFVGGRDDTSTRDQWSAEGVVSLDYFLEDHTKITAELRESQVRQGPVPRNPSGDTFFRSEGFFLALTYRFFGRVSAPGLMETMRPL